MANRTTSMSPKTQPTQQSYAAVVKTHLPNEIPVQPVLPQLFHSPRTRKTKKERKRELYKVKLRNNARCSGKSNIKVIHNYELNNNDKNQITNSMSNNKANATSTSQPEWQPVQRKNEPFEQALPRSFLLPKAPFQTSVKQQHVIGIALSITPGSQSGTSVFITPKLLSKVLSSFQHVDSNVSIIPLNDDDLPVLSDATSLLTMEDNRVEPYV
jgi:DNA-binding transcriptional regulator of glucitol operon